MDAERARMKAGRGGGSVKKVGWDTAMGCVIKARDRFVYGGRAAVMLPWHYV